MEQDGNPLRGRGAFFNPENRFDGRKLELDEYIDELPNAPLTEILEDASKSILSRNDSPDISFEFSVNPYRGCEHGCVYCYARPTHEYMGLSLGLDFETKLFVKKNAPELLREALNSRKWQPQTVILSGVTDPYQPIEREFKITRACLEVFLEFRNPVVIITKNSLVVRDLDILKELAKYQAVFVVMSVTTVDDELQRKLEPRASTPQKRLKAIEALAAHQIPVGVNAAPIIPGLTEHEIPEILKQARAAGAQTANYTMVRLPYGVKDLFEEWINQVYPDRAKKVLHRIQEIRGGNLNDSRFKSRMVGEGIFAEQIKQLFKVAKKKAGYPEESASLSIENFIRPQGPQMSLFDE